MQRRLLLGVLAIAAGCQTADRGRTPDRAPDRDWGRPTARNPARPRLGSDDWAAAPAVDPATRTASRGRDVLAGFVLTPDGRKAKNVSVEIEPATGASAGAPVEVRTDDAGYFRIQGLKAGQSYVLTARVQAAGDSGGRPVVYGGQVYASTGSARSEQIALELVEGLVPKTGVVLEPANDGFGRLPPPQLPDLNDAPPFGPHDLALPRPPATGNGFNGPVDPLPVPTSTGSGPPPPPSFPPLTVAPRPDLRTAGPPSFDPPLTRIPPLTGPTSARKPDAKSGTEFVLTDASNITREFPTGRYVLLDFMSTQCVPCTRSIPKLNAIQDKYADRGLEVIGVLCDDKPAETRRQLIAQYTRKHQLNYPLLTEPADTPTGLARRFQVEGYPTLVLLDPAGDVVWSGHPADAAELADFIR